MKKSVLAVLGLFLINLTSAALFNSGYGYGFSPASFLSGINLSEILTFVAVFALFFAPIFIALSRFFKNPDGSTNKAVPGIMAMSVAFLIVKYFFYDRGFDFGNFSSSFSSGIGSGIGISGDLMYPILSIVSLLLIVFVFYIFGRRVVATPYGPRSSFSFWGAVAGLFFVLGLLTLATVFFTDIIAEKGIAGIIGLVMLGLSLMFWGWSRNAIMVAGGATGQWYMGQRQSMFKQIFSGTPLIILGILIMVWGGVMGFNWYLVLIGAGVALVGYFFRKSTAPQGYQGTGSRFSPPNGWRP